MAKAMLIMDMPKSCVECRLSENGKICKDGNRLIFDIVEKKGVLTQEYIGLTAKPDWCQLREVPKKIDYASHFKEDLQSIDFSMGYTKGYNACIDKILNEN